MKSLNALLTPFVATQINALLPGVVSEWLMGNIGIARIKMPKQTAFKLPSVIPNHATRQVIVILKNTPSDKRGRLPDLVFTIAQSLAFREALLEAELKLLERKE